MSKFYEYDSHLERSEDYLNSLPRAQELQSKASAIADKIQHDLSTNAMEQWLKFTDLMNERSTYVSGKLFDLGFSRGRQTVVQAARFLDAQHEASTNLVNDICRIIDQTVEAIRQAERGLIQSQNRFVEEIQRIFLLDEEGGEKDE